MTRKLSELPDGHQEHRALAFNILAVMTKRCDGYRVYLGAVEGIDHTQEWQAVAHSGQKQYPGVAQAIVTDLFGYETDIPYVR